MKRPPYKLGVGETRSYWIIFTMGTDVNERLSAGVRGGSGLDVVQLPAVLVPAVSKIELLLSHSVFINCTERMKCFLMSSPLAYGAVLCFHLLKGCRQ